MPKQNHPHETQAEYRRKFFSPVWIIPAVALVAITTLAIHSWHDRGPDITISFQKVDNVEAQRTQIRHKGVVLGLVTGITPSEDFSHVEVAARMNGVAEKYLGSDAKFWVVHPRVSAGGISGLGTILSGAYIEMQPGHGNAVSTFNGLDEPLAIDSDEAGTLYTIEADRLPSIERGSPVYYHGLTVGEVANFQLDSDGKKVILSVFIHAPYDQLVHEGTKFWNISGVGLSVGTEGVKLSASSLQAILAGGLAFDVPAGGEQGDIAKPGDVFTLYDSAADANNSAYTHAIEYRLVFRDRMPVLEAGAPVILMGTVVGFVDNVELRADTQTGHAISTVTIKILPQKFNVNGTEDKSIEERGRDAIHAMVRQGLRAEISTSNFLTSQKNVSLIFVPHAPPAILVESDEAPELPTLPATDINMLIADLDDAAQEAGPLMDSIKETSDQLGDMVRDADNGDSSGNVAGAMRELKEMARSVRGLADYLDAHPEAILTGKKEDSQ